VHLNRSILVLILLISFNLNGFGQIIHEFSVRFESNSFLLSQKAERKIDSVLSLLTNVPKAYQINATGYTDSTGGTSFNKQLSIKRAIQVTKLFDSKGFLTKKTHYNGKGSSSPIGSNQNEAGKARNRRVEIIITIDIPKINSIGGLQIKNEKFSINSNEGGIISYSSGTKISIAPNTFVDSKGNPIKGKIEIIYREYRDPIDFIFSDIPMSIIQNGKSYPFNSAGMFKIQATKNGTPIFINEGKKINIDFAVTEELSNTNFYRFDEENNHWGEIAKLTDQNGSQLGQEYWMRTVCQYIEDEKVCSMEDCDALYFITQKGTLFSASKLSISQQLQTEDELKSKSNQLSNLSLKKLNDEIGKKSLIEVNYTRYLSLQQHRYQLKTEEIKKGKSLLSINYNSTSNNEFQSYENIKWSYSSKNDNIPDSILSKTWENCELTRNRNEYELFLSNEKDSYSIKGLSLVPSEKIKKKQKKKYNDTFYDKYETGLLKYQSNLAQIKASKDSLTAILDSLRSEKHSVETIINLNDSLVMELHKDSLFCFWDKSKPYMEKVEKSLIQEDWLKYFDNHKAEMKERYNAIKNDKEKYDYCARMARLKIEMDKEIEKNRERLASSNTGDNYEASNEKANIVVQSLSISKLGIYNCDQVGRLKNPVTVIANYIDNNNNPIEPILAFLIDNTFNGLLRYDGNYGLSPYVFAFSPTSGNTLIVFDENSNAYIYRPQDFNKITNIENRFKHTFKVEKIKTLQSKNDILNQ